MQSFIKLLGEEIDVPKAVLSLIICVVGLLGNLFAIFIILVLREYKKSVTHWYVFQLAIADSIFLISLSFQVNEDLNQGWDYPEWMCKAKQTVLFLNYYASMFFLVVMSIDRYVAVCQTFSTGLQKLRTQKSAYIITILMWSVALLFCIPAMMYSHKVGVEPHCLCKHEFPSPPPNHTAECIKESGGSAKRVKECLAIVGLTEVGGDSYCKPQSSLDDAFNLLFGSGSENSLSINGFSDIGDGSSKVSPNATVLPDVSGINFTFPFIRRKRAASYTRSQACDYSKNSYSWSIYILFNFIVMFIFPLLIMVVCYGLIIRRVSTTKTRFTSVKKPLKNSSSSQKKKSLSRSDKDRRRVTIMCVALVSCFVICWLPYHAVHVAKFVGINSTTTFCSTISTVGTLLAYLNSALNPYLYSFLGTNFSKRWRMLKRSPGIQQLVSLRAFRPNDPTSSNKKDSVNQSARCGPQRYHEYQNSDKISGQRPTLTTKVPRQMETSQAQTPDTSYDKQMQTQEGMLSSTKSQTSGEI